MHACIHAPCIHACMRGVPAALLARSFAVSMAVSVGVSEVSTSTGTKSEGSVRRLICVGRVQHMEGQEQVGVCAGGGQGGGNRQGTAGRLMSQSRLAVSLGL